MSLKFVVVDAVYKGRLLLAEALLIFYYLYKQGNHVPSGPLVYVVDSATLGTTVYTSTHLLHTT